MTIDTNLILAVIGIAITIILGYIGLKLTLKNRKKIEIIFLKNTCISLFRTIEKNLEDLEINFQGKKINENLILFKGTFLNSGNIDIEKQIVYKPLEIELPAQYNWLRVKIIDASEGLEINSTFIDNKIFFVWDLLKEGEYFTFDGLIEYKAKNGEIDTSDISKKLESTLKINHRITDLKKVKRENSVPKPSHLSVIIIFNVLLLGFSIFSSYNAISLLNNPSYQAMIEVNTPKGKQYVTLKAENKDEISLINQDGTTINSTSKFELSPRINPKVTIQKIKVDYVGVSVIGLFAILSFGLWLILNIAEFKERRLFKKLKRIREKYDQLDFDESQQSKLKLFSSD